MKAKVGPKGSYVPMLRRAQKELKQTMGHPAQVGMLQPCANAAAASVMGDKPHHADENIVGKEVPGM